jgi:hypothetical protein
MEQTLRDIIKKEGVVRNEPVMLLKSEDVTEHGRLILTTKRIFFARNVINTSSFSRYFINEQELEAVIDIDLDTINKISRESYLVDTNILSLTYLQYKNVSFSVINYDEWEMDIERTRMNPDIPGDPNKPQEEAA